MSKSSPADAFACLLAEDAVVGVDPTVYTYHRFEWTGTAKEYADESTRRATHSWLPPLILTDAFDKPSSLKAGVSLGIDDAVAWIRKRAEEHFVFTEFSRPVNAGSTPFQHREQLQELGDELPVRLDWACLCHRHSLRFGKPISTVYQLHNSKRLWLCVIPQPWA